MTQDVLSLTQALIAIPSVSRDGNEVITQFLSTWLEQQGFEVETLVYQDANGISKYSLVAKLGQDRVAWAFSRTVIPCQQPNRNGPPLQQISKRANFMAGVAVI